MYYILFAIFFIIIIVLCAWHSHRKHKSIVQSKLFNIIDNNEINKYENDFLSLMLQEMGKSINTPPNDDDIMFIDKSIKSGIMLQKFEIKTFKWNFVLLAGAFVGNHMMKYNGFKWKKDENGKFCMTKTIGNNTVDIYPFDKIIKHYEVGDIGDLFAYMKSSENINIKTAQQGDAPEPVTDLLLR